MVNDQDGQRVRCGIVVDTDAKVRERVAVCYDFANQLDLPVSFHAGDNALRFPNGSEIIGVTAGGKRAGASMSFHRWHLTELPFWRDPLEAYSSLMQCLVKGGRIGIETTMGIDDPLAKDLWCNDNDFYKRFFPFEDHQAYRMEPDHRILTPDLEEYLRSQGFSDPESMTFWVWLLQNRCGNDLVRCFREYPQRPEHSWMFAEGRWISVTPPKLPPKAKERVNSQNGIYHLNVYQDRHDGSGQYVIGVDTAAALGLDHSAIAVVDCSNNTLVAELVSNGIMIDDLAEATLLAQQLYTSEFNHPTFGRQARVPPVVVEENSIGQATLQACRLRGVHRVVEHHTTKPLQEEGLLMVKRYVEAGILKGPEALADECDSLCRDKQKFVGRKDLCMAISFCYHWLAENPYSPDVLVKDRGPRANFFSKLKR